MKPKTILIDLSEGEEDPVPFTIKSQDQLDKQLLRTGAHGLMNGTHRAILEVEELVDGDAYTMSLSGKARSSSGLASEFDC
jgi:hypothetical protein